MLKTLKAIFLNTSLTFVFILFLISMAGASDFCVSNAADLHSALTTAESNWQHDVIKIVQGTYSGNFVYDSDEDYDLTIEGGYTEGCFSRVVDPANTVLDGGGSGTVLELSSFAAVNFSIESITLKNGQSFESGGLHVYGGIATLSLTNNTISGNDADFGGGGLCAWGVATLTLTNNTISDNYALEGAGLGVYGVETIILTNNIISGNYGGYDGGLCLSAKTVTLTNNIISDNWSVLGGASLGVHDVETIILTNNIISGNYGYYGGGLCAWDVGTLTLTNNTISGNSAEHPGGGLYAVNVATITLTNNIISGNDGRLGGGLCLSAETVTLTNNTISGNDAEFYGGGLCAWDVGTLTLTNNTISGNSAEHPGGGLYAWDVATLTLTNNTISGNSAEEYGGIGIYKISHTAHIYNNIIWNNTAEWEVNDLYIYTGIDSTVNLFNNDFDQSADGFYINIPFTIDPSNLNNEDPLFVDPDNGDYHLQEDSPCIDMGTNSAPQIPDTDFESDVRIIDGDNDGIAKVDMGADEYVSPAGILNFFDTAVEDEKLVGSGQGKSSERRLNALRKMIQTAGDLIDQGNIAGACDQLQDAYNRTDSQFPPPDFATGPAAPQLATMIDNLMTNLGCE